MTGESTTETIKNSQPLCIVCKELICSLCDVRFNDGSFHSLFDVCLYLVQNEFLIFFRDFKKDLSAATVEYVSHGVIVINLVSWMIITCTFFKSVYRTINYWMIGFQKPVSHSVYSGQKLCFVIHFLPYFEAVDGDYLFISLLY